jgi:methyl-accepting chemotaxis protein
MTQIQKLTLGLAAMAVTASVWGFTSLSVISGLSDYLGTSVGATTAGIDQLGQIGRAASDMVGMERALVLHSMFGQTDETVKDKQRFDSAANNLKASVAGLPAELKSGAGKSAADTLQAELSGWSALHSELSQWLDKQQADEAEKMLRDKIQPVSEKMQEAARILSASGRSQLQKGAGESADKAKRSRNSAFVFMAIFLTIGASVLMVVRRTGGRLRLVSGQIAEIAGELGSAAAQLADGSRRVSKWTASQAGSIEQTSASSTHVEAMSRQNAADSKQAAIVMAQVDQKVVEANHTLGQMVKSMNEIKSSSENIARIIRIIDEIAFQTNILALNAAVEAARAGPSGVGFAVVADEVRNLAQRSAQAARDTGELIEESVVRARTGSERLDQVARVIAGITADTSRVKVLVDQVEVASAQQSDGIRQISQALTEMEQITRQTAAGAEESRLASEGLNSQSGTVREVVLELAKVAE